eukprot:Rhum_TRINITY_DN14666_c10_g2::Rhum_TRINITY_DN14666_c10_g2_i1::g.107245::m.107245
MRCGGGGGREGGGDGEKTVEYRRLFFSPGGGGSGGGVLPRSHPPLVVALQARDKLRHRLVARPDLQLKVRAASPAAPAAAVHGGFLHGGRRRVHVCHDLLHHLRRLGTLLRVAQVGCGHLRQLLAGQAAQNDVRPQPVVLRVGEVHAQRPQLPPVARARDVAREVSVHRLLRLHRAAHDLCLVVRPRILPQGCHELLADAQPRRLAVAKPGGQGACAAAPALSHPCLLRLRRCGGGGGVVGGPPLSRQHLRLHGRGSCGAVCARGEDGGRSGDGGGGGGGGRRSVAELRGVLGGSVVCGDAPAVGGTAEGEFVDELLCFVVAKDAADVASKSRHHRHKNPRALLLRARVKNRLQLHPDAILYGTPRGRQLRRVCVQRSGQHVDRKRVRQEGEPSILPTPDYQNLGREHRVCRSERVLVRPVRRVLLLRIAEAREQVRAPVQILLVAGGALAVAAARRLRVGEVHTAHAPPQGGFVAGDAQAVVFLVDHDDGRTVAAGQRDGRLDLRDELRPHRRPVLHVALDRHGARASGGEAAVDEGFECAVLHEEPQPVLLRLVARRGLLALHPLLRVELRRQQPAQHDAVDGLALAQGAKVAEHTARSHARRVRTNRASNEVQIL